MNIKGVRIWSPLPRKISYYQDRA